MTTLYKPFNDEYAGEVDLASSLADGVVAKRSNVLSNKLTSVLSSSYTDSELRDALRLLDAQGTNTTVDTKWNVKYDAQQGVIAANGRVLDDFEKVAKQLQRVGSLIASLNQTCDELRSHIILAKQETLPMLEEATTLLARKEETDLKQHLLNAFCEHFLISDDDLNTLTNSTQSVDQNFFAVLGRAKQIHKDCELLLGQENQRLGLELMEQTTRHLDAGYKKLYNWIQREFKGLDLEDPQISGSIRRSLRALSERPTLFQNCLDYFAEARQATLADAFQKALTESTIGTSKAIEFSTHDPLRYIGDMLAWVHSTTVSEIEALEGLFISDADEISRGFATGTTSEPWSRLRQTSSQEEEKANAADVKPEVFDGHTALTSLISRNLFSVCQILYSRVSLTIRNLSDPVEVYKAYNLEAFYYDMFLKLVKDKQQEMTLLSTMTSLQSSTLSQFEAIMADDFSNNVDDQIPYDFSPPLMLRQTLSQFTAIVQLRSPNLTKAEFVRLYQTMLTSPLNHCAEVASSFQDVETHPRHSSTIYSANYLTLVHATLQSVTTLAPFAEDPVKHASSELSSLQSSLEADMVTEFLEISGVRALRDRLDEAAKQSDKLSPVQKRKYIISDNENGLEDLAQQLDTFLAHALMDVQEDLNKLGDKRMAREVLANVVEVFCTEFEGVVGELDELDMKREADKFKQQTDTGEQNGVSTPSSVEDEVEPSLRGLYPRTTAEVEALLS